MTDEKLARIVSFSNEQGFGRVDVVGEGELVFDTSIAQCPIESLTVGAEVRVTTGAGRVAGQKKVTRLWSDTAAPPAPPPAEVADRFASFGPYSYLLPPFWPDAPVAERGPIWTAGAKLDDVQCVLVVCVGGATDPRAKAGLIASRGEGARVTRCDRDALGLSFEGFRFDRRSDAELLFVAEAHGDLLTAGCVYAKGRDEAAERLSPLLLTMVAAAVHRRGPPAPSPAAKTNNGGFWKRLFGR